VYGNSYGRKLALDGQRIINFSMENGSEDHQLGTGFFVHKRIVSAFRRVEFAGAILLF
jgi:hypothetical protein